MDHIPLPDGAHHYIKVLYPVDEQDYYDGRGFFDFPRRRGYSDLDLAGLNNFSGKADEDVENFFHTWLYFGAAIELFEAVGVHITTDLLLMKENRGLYKFVNTVQLSQIFEDWKAVVGKDTEQELPPAFEKILLHVREIMNRFCTHRPGVRQATTGARPKWPVSDEISATILALYSWFELQADQLYGSGPKATDKKAISTLLQLRLERKWCKYDVAVMMDDFHVDTLYYMGAAPNSSQEYLDDHRDCTEYGCVYKKDERAYVTKHAPECHNSDCNFDMTYGGHLGPERPMPPSWVKAICGIIDRGAIPLMIWPQSLRTCWSVEYHLTGKRKPPYVAISHVWADGMGNPFANELPLCQLERIQKLVDELPVVDHKNDTQWWMDTICLPAGKELHEYKDKAIVEMRHIYQNASAVLVLDAWVQEIPSTAPTPELISRLSQSNWLRRLWTHQEGYLPKEVYIRFKDKALSLEELMQRGSDWANSTGIEKNNIVSDPLLECIIPYTFLKGVMTSHDASKDGSTVMDPSVFTPLIMSLELRRTTKAKDEMLCLASILNLDVKSYLKISGKDAEKERMIHFYKTVKKFYSTIIFSYVDRLDVPGFGWAPKSLIGQRVHNFQPPLTGFEDEKVIAEVQGENLDEGLLVWYPSFTFGFTARDSMSIGSIQRRFLIPIGNSRDGRTSRHCSVNVFPNNIKWGTEGLYALIVAQSLEAHGESTAVLGSYTWSGGKNILRHLCHAIIYLREELGNDDHGLDEVKVAELPPNTEWLVT